MNVVSLFKCKNKNCNIIFKISDDNLRYNKKTHVDWMAVCPKCRTRKFLKELPVLTAKENEKF